MSVEADVWLENGTLYVSTLEIHIVNSHENSEHTYSIDWS